MTLATDWRTLKGWLTPREREAIYELSRRVNDTKSTLVNIGIEYGASLHCMNAGANLAYRVGIDISTNKLVNRGGAEVYEMDSHEACERWGGDKVDFLFIDGDHSYEGVKRDLEWVAHMSPSSYIMLHDCYDWPPAPERQVHSICPGVNQAVEEWIAGGGSNYREICFVNTSRIFGRGRYAQADPPA